MKYINEKMNLKEIIEKYPETIDFFTSKGFKDLDKAEVRDKAGKISLKLALSMKKLSSDTFIEMLEEIISQNRDSADITLNESIKKKME